MAPWQPRAPLGVPPRTRCPSAQDTSISAEYGLTLAAFVILLTSGHPIVTSLTIPLAALLGVRTIRTVRLGSASWLSRLLRHVLSNDSFSIDSSLG